jgi:hypothetical protein
MGTRLTNLQNAVSAGAGRADPPSQIYDSRTQQMLAGTRPVGRYLCVTAEQGHESNADYTVVATLTAAREQFDRELNGEGLWLPLALIDLNTRVDLVERVGLRAEIDGVRT